MARDSRDVGTHIEKLMRVVPTEYYNLSPELREASQLIRDLIARAERAEARIAELENINSYNLQIVREATALIAALKGGSDGSN